MGAAESLVLVNRSSRGPYNRFTRSHKSGAVSRAQGWNTHTLRPRVVQELNGCAYGAFTGGSEWTLHHGQRLSYEKYETGQATQPSRRDPAGAGPGPILSAADLQSVCIHTGLGAVPSMVGVIPSMVGMVPSMVGADLQSVCIHTGLGIVVGVGLGLGVPDR